MTLAARILDIYTANSHGVFAAVEDAVAKDDGEALRNAAHSLKSSSANVGATQLVALLKAFEMMGKQGRLHDAHAQLEKLRLEYTRAIDDIRALRQEYES